MKLVVDKDSNFEHKSQKTHALPNRIDIGKVDGALVDENGFYLSHPETKAEIVRRYNSQPELLDALRQLATLSEADVPNANIDAHLSTMWKLATSAIAKAEGRQS